jgi:2-dehydropantoate 2-reductase
MKILIYGAGVLGSLYAARLCESGQDVTLLARGARLTELQANGIVLEEAATGQRSTTRVPLVDRLDPEDAYDLVAVIMRRNQLAEVLPALAANHHTPNVLFMTNNAAGPAGYTAALGSSRVLLGFPGAGGVRAAGVVRYMLAGSQPTSIGDIDGTGTERVRQISGVFRKAGFPVAVRANMDAWLKTHVALVSPIANAIYAADGDVYRLARTREALVLMVRAVREGLRVLGRLGIQITPGGMRALLWIPEPLLGGLLERRLGSPEAELGLAGHANAARDEMGTLAAEFRELARRSGVATPCIDRLYDYIDPAKPPLPDGKAVLG